MWEMTKLEPTPTALTSDGLGYVIICIFIKIFCWQLYVVATDADLTFFLSGLGHDVSFPPISGPEINRF